MTSHDVVAKIRRGLQLKKVGHAGTLDPLATGVLVICVGAATRLSEYVMQSSKCYRAQVRLGIITDTYDAEGEIMQESDPGHITRAIVENVLPLFTGEIEQIPPMYSAIKQAGRKLYDLARAGEVVKREARPVRIYKLEIADWSPPEFTLDVICTAGTYIRSLAYDLGETLGVGAHLAGLVRMSSGAFTLERAIRLDNLLTAEDWQQYLIPPHQALTDWPIIELDTVMADHIRHGRTIPAARLEPDGTLAMAYMNDSLVAVIESADGRWRPHKVFSTEQMNQ